MSDSKKAATAATTASTINDSKNEKKDSDKKSKVFTSSKPKSKSKTKEKSKTSSPAPDPPPPKKSPSPGPSKSSKGPPRAGGNRDGLRLPRLNRSATSLGPGGSRSSLHRSRSAASSPCATKKPLGSVTPRFPVNNIPIPVPDIPKSARVRMRNTASESESMVNGHINRLSYNEGVFSPGLANTSRRRPEFVIHPEWASEGISADKLPPLPHPFRTKHLQSDSAASSCPTTNLWPKRCKSAPPPNYRNPITWE